ncbi:MAG: hypothetical protein ACOC44_20265 [Promethearchaeia archaeon]
MKKLHKYWENNIKSNYKKISSIIGDMLVGVLGILFVGIKIGFDATTIIIMIIFVVKPYIFNTINIVFKGEKADLEAELARQNKQLEYAQEISEYRCQLAARDGNIPEAIKANKDWNDANG